MSTRILCTLLALLAGGALALVAEESGAIRTNVTTTTTAPPAVAPVSKPSTKIWSALVLATNADDPKPAPSELREFTPKMKKVFGYNQFQLIGSTSQEIGDRTPSRLAPSKSF